MRPFITVGMATFLILLALALTSNRFAVRRLGRRWQTLHRLVYVAGDLRRRALLVAGESGHHRAAAMGGPGGGPAGHPCVVGVSRAVSEDRSERLMRSQPQSDVPFDD